ncbi:DUF4132 domain-containing protein [bacterium]|nr:DUF4132 domain-containing protein [bacterium]
MEPSVSLLKKVLAWRGGPVPAPSYDLKKAVSRLHQVRALEALKPGFAQLKAQVEPQHQSLLAQRVGGSIDQIESFVPEVEAALLCMMGGNDRAWDRAHEIGADMVYLWCARAGVVGATHALLLNMEYTEGGERSRDAAFNSFFPYIGPWKALRGQLAGASQSDYDQALGLARRLAWGQVAWLAAFAFPTEEDLVDQAVSEVLSLPQAMRGLGLLASARTGQQFAQLCAHLKNYLAMEQWTGIKLTDYLPSSMARLGDESFEGLRVLGESAEKAGHKRLLGELLCELSHPGVGPWLQARIKDKAYAPIAHAYAAKSTLSSQSAPAEPAGEQPTLLSRPPWDHRLPKTRPLIETVTLPELPEVVHFSPARLQFILEHTKQRKSTKYRELWDELPNDSFFPEELCELDDRAWALKVWNESPARRWNPYSLRNNYFISVAERILACFGTQGLPGLLTCLSVAPDVIYAALSLVESARLAPVWAEAWATKKKFRKLASGWFLRYPVAAAHGLLPLALGPAGKPRGYAEAALRWLAARGQRELLYKLAPGPALEQILSYDPLQELPARMPALPAWFRPDLARAPQTLKGVTLTCASMSNLAFMAAISSLDAPYPGLFQTECEPSSLAAFAWSVFEQWLQAGGPPKEDWGFRILAYWGGDEAARRLAPELRKWPNQGLSARAAVGLDILRYLGSDVALTHLHGIALKVRSKALQDKALEHIQEVAEERGLSLDELGDRLVPYLETESLAAYGVSFDELLTPVANIPKSAPAEVQEAWKALKKDAKTVVSVQLARLELALTSRRRWSSEDFRELLVNHPLLIHLVRRLVWGIYEDDRLISSFRVAEDGTYANAADQLVEVAGTVGLVHPLDGSLAEWRQILADYRILQPFAQVDRSVHHLPGGFEGRELDLYEGMSVHAGHVLALESRGWRRGDVESGCLLELQRGSFRLDLNEGIPLEQISGCVVCLGKLYADQELHLVSPVQVSEAIRDLEWLSEKKLISA